MTENEFAHYQSIIINHVDSVTIEEARECVGVVLVQSNTTSKKIFKNKRTHLMSLCIMMIVWRY